jgi:hypothetical protein
MGRTKFNNSPAPFSALVSIQVCNYIGLAEKVGNTGILMINKPLYSYYQS